MAQDDAGTWICEQSGHEMAQVDDDLLPVASERDSIDEQAVRVIEVEGAKFDPAGLSACVIRDDVVHHGRQQRQGD